MNFLSSLSRRDARLLAIAFLLLLIWVFHALIAAPLLAAHATLSSEIDSSRRQLGRLDAVIGRVHQGQSAGQGDQLQSTWQGTSPQVIAANAQKKVQSLAQSAGITLVSISQTRSSYDQTFRTAGLAIEGHGEIAAFVDLFTALERNRPLLFVDKLILRRFLPPGNTQKGSRLPLSARFEIHAPHQIEPAQ
ncbi:type II secretion system protein GspM [Roseibium sp. MMSF_3412]|uniref:type II secretion system protein GspM n=1 Tax=Roseibium sp. MMSF_3412 TaxID=3046712 RepID=UPI00273F3241|nr:type II secretion system protein GspM [Roseibium sp. MMSF_3412]